MFDNILSKKIATYSSNFATSLSFLRATNRLDCSNTLFNPFPNIQNNDFFKTYKNYKTRKHILTTKSTLLFPTFTCVQTINWSKIKHTINKRLKTARNPYFLAIVLGSFSLLWASPLDSSPPSIERVENSSLIIGTSEEVSPALSRWPPSSMAAVGVFERFDYRWYNANCRL